MTMIGKRAGHNARHLMDRECGRWQEHLHSIEDFPGGAMLLGHITCQASFVHVGLARLLHPHFTAYSYGTIELCLNVATVTLRAAPYDVPFRLVSLLQIFRAPVVSTEQPAFEKTADGEVMEAETIHEGTEQHDPRGGTMVKVIWVCLNVPVSISMQATPVRDTATSVS